MPKGPFEFKRFTSIGPFVREEDDALYHMTRQSLLEEVLENGIKSSTETRLRALDPLDDSLLTAVLQKHTMIEYLFDYFKPEDKNHLPNRANSVFFFGSVDKIEEELRSLKQYESPSETKRTAVLAVDPNKIPCTGAIANFDTAKTVVSMFHDELITEVPLPKGDKAPDKTALFKAYDEFVFSRYEQELLADYWNSVTAYDGYASKEEEVWFNCDVPPEAINSIITREGLR